MDEPQPHEEAREEGAAPLWRSTLVMSWKKSASEPMEPGESTTCYSENF